MAVITCVGHTGLFSRREELLRGAQRCGRPHLTVKDTSGLPRAGRVSKVLTVPTVAAHYLYDVYPHHNSAPVGKPNQLPQRALTSGQYGTGDLVGKGGEGGRVVSLISYG